MGARIAPPFMEATDASRLVCVVVVSYQEYSLTQKPRDKGSAQAAAASQNEAEESDESAEDDGAGEREKRERREWDDREVA